MRKEKRRLRSSVYVPTSRLSSGREEAGMREEHRKGEREREAEMRREQTEMRE